MKRQHGFTLIEMMIVVGIIAILSAIAIPNLLRSRVQSNEAAAIQNIRTVIGAQTVFQTANQRFAADFAELTAGNPAFLDGSWDPANGGYLYVLVGTDYSFTLNVNAKQYGVTGNRGFYTDTSGVIRYAEMADADSASTPIG